MASAKIIELDETNTCKICDNALAKYSCPRCNVIYCSLSCYQAVGHLDCSESFYKESVEAELSLNTKESQAKMFEILQRSHEENRIPSPYFFSGAESSEDDNLDDLELNPNNPFNFMKYLNSGDDDYEDEVDSDDDVDTLNITERLAGVDLDDPETVWEKLTEDERQDFVAFLKTEDVSKLIPSWEPWWLYSEEGKVTEVTDYKSRCPKLVEIKDFSMISKKEAASSVKFNLVNLLGAYAFATRYFNGDYMEFPHECLACIDAVCLSLSRGENFEDYESAVKSIEQECIYCEWIITDAENLELMKDDLRRILKGPSKHDKNFYILCALSDIQNLLVQCQKPKEQKPVGGFSKMFANDHMPTDKFQSKEKIKTFLRKTDYLLSYAKDVFQM